MPDDKYQIARGSIRGGWRPAETALVLSRLRKHNPLIEMFGASDPLTRISTDTVRLLTKGGVKGGQHDAS
jgi:hypothetical protein